MGFPNQNKTGASLQIQYPSSLPYQAVLPADGTIPASGGTFSLHTVTENDVGDAVSVALGPAGGINGWTIIVEGAAVATNGGETLLNLASSQLKIGTDGNVVVIVASENLGTPYDTFTGDAGKLIPSVSISGGQVLLTFTPVGDPALTIYHGVTGTVASARG
jgi:hypothetical protein